MGSWKDEPKIQNRLMDSQPDPARVEWLYQEDAEHAHAFFVPGQGWYGGLPPEVAKQIVLDHNRMLRTTPEWEEIQARIAAARAKVFAR